MANIKSSKKNILINARNRARNIHFRTRMKSAIRAAKEAIESKLPDRLSILENTLRIIDKTASKRIITKKAAASKKSKLALQLNATLDGSEKAPEKPAKKAAAKKPATKKAAPKKEAAAKKPAAKKAAPKKTTEKKDTTES